MKLNNILVRTYNFHKDNFSEILLSLIVNFMYAFFALCVPTFISLKYDLGVLVALGIYYGFLVYLFSRPKYETLYGKLLFWFACTSGGFTGYKFSSFLVTLL